jgi:hypothetical protein
LRARVSQWRVISGVSSQCQRRESVGGESGGEDTAFSENRGFPFRALGFEVLCKWLCYFLCYCCVQ